MPTSSFIADQWPISGIPKTPFAGRVERWFHTDHEEAFRQLQHPEITSDEVEYTFNRHGYRTNEFDLAPGFRVLCLGESVTFGVGVPQQQTFAQMFCDELAAANGHAVTLWNLAWPDASNDRTARLALCAVPELRPHLVLTAFSPLSRREFLDANGQLVEFDPMKRPTFVDRHVYSGCTYLTSPYEDRINFLKNYTMIKQLLTIHNCRWLWFSLPHRLPPDLQSHVSYTEHVELDFHPPDVARDGLHPGIRSHKAIADQLYAAYRKRDEKPLNGKMSVKHHETDQHLPVVPSTTYRKFIVVGMARSGWHFFRSGLMSRTGVECHDEPFNEFAPQPLPFEMDAEQIVSEKLFCEHPDNVLAVGFKIEFRQPHYNFRWRVIWDMLRRDTDLRVIFLRRRNLLARFLSEQVAMRTNRWVLHNGETMQLPPPLTLAPQACLEQFQWAEKQYQLAGGFFEGHQNMLVEYEQLCEDYSQTMSMVQRFLEIPVLDIQAKTQKIENRPLSLAIANFDDLKRRFANTAYASFFDGD